MGLHVTRCRGSFVAARPRRGGARVSRSIAGPIALAAALFLACLGPAGTQDDAKRISETHGDWLVVCGAPPQASQKEAGGRSCFMRQDQKRENGQRLLAMEMRRSADGGAIGTLLMPFGILFSKGITPRVDDHPRMGALAFRTCLPAGCLAVFPINPQSLKRMRKGTALKLGITTVGNKKLTFSVSLRGFTAAFERLRELSPD